MFCVQLAGLFKRPSAIPIIKVHAAQRNNIIRAHNLKGMELSLNENTHQAQILFYMESEENVRDFLQSFQDTISPYAPFLEKENRLNIATVTAYEEV